MMVKIWRSVRQGEAERQLGCPVWKRESSGESYQYVQIPDWGGGVKNTELDSGMPNIMIRHSGPPEFETLEIPNSI